MQAVRAVITCEWYEMWRHTHTYIPVVVGLETKARNGRLRCGDVTTCGMTYDAIIHESTPLHTRTHSDRAGLVDELRDWDAGECYGDTP